MAATRELCYFGSDNPVRVGDRILVRQWLGRSRLGTVVYVPGQVASGAELGDDQWAYKTDDGAVFAAGYFPDQVPHAGRSIGFVARAGKEAAEVIRSYRIPLEPSPTQPGRDFLALIGCGAIIAIIFTIGYGVVRWVVGR